MAEAQRLRSVETPGIEIRRKKGGKTMQEVRQAWVENDRDTAQSLAASRETHKTLYSTRANRYICSSSRGI